MVMLLLRAKVVMPILSLQRENNVSNLSIGPEGLGVYLLVSCCGMIAHVLLKRARTVRRVDQLIIDLSVMIFALWGPGLWRG